MNLRRWSFSLEWIWFQKKIKKLLSLRLIYFYYTIFWHITCCEFFFCLTGIANIFFRFLEAEIISSRNGKSKLLKYQSFTYSFKYMTRLLMHWRCSTHHAKGCPGGITTFNNSNKVVTIKGEHNHAVSNLKLRVRSKTKGMDKKMIFVESTAIQLSD